MALSEVTKAWIGLVVSDLLSLAIFLWVFDSDAARGVVAACAVGFTVGMLFRIVELRRKDKPTDSWPPARDR